MTGRANILFLCLFVALWWIGSTLWYPDDYDDGVYLATARSLASGHSLYSEVFFGQTPLSGTLFAFGAKWISSDEIGGRVVILIFSVMSLFGVGLIAFRLFGTRGMLAATVLLAIQLSRFGALWTLQAEMVAMGWALLALGVSVTPSKRQLGMVCAGVLVAAGMLCKVWVVPLLIPMLLSPLVACDDFQRGRFSLPDWLRRTGLAAVAGSLIAVMVLSCYDLESFYAQAIQFHIDARSVFDHDIGRNIDVICKYTAAFGGITLLAFIGFIVGLSRRAVSFWMISWLLASLWFLLWHTPLFAHHVLLLAPIMSLWGCAAVLGLMDRLRRAGMRPAIVEPAIALVTLGLATLNVAGPEGGWFQIIQNSNRKRACARDQAAIEIVQRLAVENELVGGDDQGLIFRAGRESPPELCDTSFVRIRSGYLPPAEAVSAASRCKVIVLGTGRLRQLAEFQEWLEARFETAAEVDSKVIFVKRGGTIRKHPDR